MKTMHLNFVFILLFLMESLIYSQVVWQKIQLPFEGEIDHIKYSISNTNVIYISLENSLYKSIDSGERWEEISTPPNFDPWTILIIDPTDSDKIYAKEKLYYEALYRSLDGGDSWVLITTHSGDDFIGFDISTKGVLYGIYSGDVYKSDDDGNSWTIISSNVPAYYCNLHCVPSNENIIYSVSPDNIIKSTDAGINWDIVYTFTDDDPWIPKFLIHPIDPNIIFVVKDSSLRTIDGFESSSWLDENNILAINGNGIIYKSSESGLFESNDFGETWTQTSNSGLIYFDLLEINPSNVQEMFGDDATYDGSGLLYSNDGGASWSQNFGFETDYIIDLDISLLDESIYITNYDGIFRIAKFNHNWEFLSPHFYNSDFLVNPFDNNYQIILYDEKSLVTINNGHTWQQNNPVPDSDWDHAVISPVDPSNIFAWDRGSYQLFRTKDMCETWESLSLPQGNIQFVKLSPNNPSIVFLKDNYELYKSLDSGSNWIKISFPDNISQTPIGPFVPLNSSNTQYYFGYDTDYWQYSIIKSTDNSDNFTINPCNFPESIYSVDYVVFNPSDENEMFGLSGGSLIASSNGGIDWQLLNNPLGVGNAIESIYYHPANYDTLIIETDEGWFKGDISSILSVIDEEHSYNLPRQTKLLNNYPNPFNPTTTISYQLPKLSFLKLSIYDINGRLVKILVNEKKNAGYYKVVWNAEQVSSGIYFYRIDAGEYSSVKKCLFVK